MLLLLSLFVIQTPNIVLVTPRGGSNFVEPQVAVEDDGHVYIAYGAGDAIFVSASTDKGTSFGAPVKVAEAGKISLGMRRGPRIAAYHGRVTVTAVYGSKGGGADGDIVTFRSADSGKSWSQGGKVNDLDGAAREGLHAMAVGPDGTLACSWLDLRAKGTKLFMSTSKDGGANWAKNRLVYESPSGSICECCHPSLAYDRSGKLTLMFRNSLDGARDMYLTSTTDGGEAFSPVVKLGKGTWMLNGCPMDGGMVAVTDGKNCMTTWRRESSVFVSATGGSEIMIGSGKQPWGAFGPDGLYAVWWGTDGIDAWTPKRNSYKLSPQGGDPVVSSSPDCKLVVAAWTDGGVRSARLSP